MANSTSDPPDRSFRIRPDALRGPRDSGEPSLEELVGFFHSHPVGSARPSRLDLENAWPWYAQVVVGFDRKAQPRFEGFTLDSIDRSEARLEVRFASEAGGG